MLCILFLKCIKELIPHIESETGSFLWGAMVKDLALSLQWLQKLLWLRFNPWPGNFYMPQVWQKTKQNIKKKKKKKQNMKKKKKKKVKLEITDHV